MKYWALVWLAICVGGLAAAEKASGNKAAAKTTLDRVLTDEPENLAALLERADLFTDEKNFELAITDLRAAAKLKPADKVVMSRLDHTLQQWEKGYVEAALLITQGNLSQAAKLI